MISLVFKVCSTYTFEVIKAKTTKPFGIDICVIYMTYILFMYININTHTPNVFLCSS